MRRTWPLAFLIGIGAAVLLARRPVPEPGTAFPPLADQETGGPAERLRSGSPPPPGEGETPEPTLAGEPETSPHKENWIAPHLSWLLRNQGEDGSWGGESCTIDGKPVGRVGATAVSLLAFLGAGYSHMSRDEFDGYYVGKAVKDAFLWLRARQRADGTIEPTGDPALEQALAALAFSEAFGMTAVHVLKQPAEDSVGALLRMQGPDGSWGDVLTNAWVATAVTSARLAELPVDEKAVLLATEGGMALANRAGGDDAPFGRLWLADARGVASERGEPERVLASLPVWRETSPSRWYFGTLALSRWDGPKGELWKLWRSQMVVGLRGYRPPEEPWDGAAGTEAVFRTGLHGLVLGVLWSQERRD